MRRFLLAVACVLALTGRASAGSFYSYTTIVDTHTNRPDGKGKFDPSDFVAIDGPWVVFRDQPNTPNDSFWSANLLTHKLTKLVDFTTPVPGGSGAFVGFQTCQAAGEDFRLHGTTLLFFGVDASAPHCSGGVYAQSVLGGKPVKIVDYRSTFPDRGTFWQLDETFKVDDLDSSVAAVAAQLTGGPGAGVYATTPSGKLKRIAADGLTIIHPTWPWPVEVYHCASVGDGDVAFVGDDTFDPVAGFNAIYAEAEAGGPISELVRSDAALPGDANPHFHGRFKCPMTDSHVVYYGEDDPNYAGPCGAGVFDGIFAVALGGGPPTKIVDSCDKLPGIARIAGMGSFGYGNNGFTAARDGTVVFGVQDAGVNNFAYFSATSGIVNRIYGVGDIVDGFAATYFGLGNLDSSATSGGRVAFRAGTSAVYPPEYAVAVASPACAANVARTIALKFGTLTYNATLHAYVQTVTATNTGATPVTGPISLVLAGLSADASLASADGTTVCVGPPGSAYQTFPVTGNALAPKASTTETMRFADPTHDSIHYTTEIAGFGAR